MAQYQRLIHEYLDGSIEQYQENMLFDELARDSSLRREFQEQMAIHRTAASDMASISTPGELGNQVFATLGISAVPLGDARLPLTARRSFKALTSLFAGAFAIMLVYLMTAQNSDSPKALKTADVAKNDAQKAAVENATQSNNSSEEILLKESSQNLFSAANSFTGNNSFKSSQSESAQNKDFKTVKNTEAPAQDFAQSFNGIFSVNSIPSDSYVLKTQDRQLPASQSFPDFITTLLKTYPLTFQATYSGSDFKTPSWTVAGLYDITLNDKFGVEIGYENFQQNFTQSVNGDINKTTTLTPNVTAGLVYRRLLPEFSPFQSIIPFAQLYGGAARNGGIAPIVKVSSGISVRPLNRLQVNFGAEAAFSPISTRYNSRYQFFAGLGLGF